MSDERCIPPEELRGVDGWHWLSMHGCPEAWRWSAEFGDWRDVTCDLIWPPEQAASARYVYAGACLTPSDLAAAKEREAALVGALRGAFAAVSASYDEAHAEWHRQDRRGEKANKIVREWRNLATALLDAITKEPTP